jgi:GTP-binding protein
MFVDQVDVTLRAGKGGDGCLSFRRERGVPRGGPNGGRGGEGGSIFFVSDKNINSLAYFRFHPLNKAKKGAHGEGGNRDGKKGSDLHLRVPVGTIIRARDREEILFDFIQDDQRYLAARGGKGGRGNASFASPTNRAPRIREEGQPGEEAELTLELKLIADVGLIGFPNVGKSTLISKISAAKPVIADYPFTTLVPNLGVVDIDEWRSFVVADIPGLIEGAHLGHGLGIKFLKHIERTKLLVHLVDVSPYTQRDPVRDYRTVVKELESFDPCLKERPQIVVANKIDLLHEDDRRLLKLKALAQREKLPFFAVSALMGEGIKKLAAAMAERLALLDADSQTS